MSSRILLGAVVMMIAACARGEQTASRDTARTTVTQAGDVTTARQQIDAANKALGDALLKGDTATLGGFYAPDAVLMLGGVKAMHGRAEIAKGFAGFLGSIKLTDASVTTDDVIVGGDLAVETGRYAWKFTAKGKPGEEIGKYLTVWQRQADGSYKIVRDISNTDPAPAPAK